MINVLVFLTKFILLGSLLIGEYFQNYFSACLDFHSSLNHNCSFRPASFSEKDLLGDISSESNLW